MPGCYDALTAAVVERSGFSAGFSAGFISGYALSASLLGKPDIGLLTPPEMAETARNVCSAATRIPLIADADTGGGNALNVQRTVQDLIAAGAAGCFPEDQAWPKKCGHMRGKQVIPAEEHAAKIAAARDVIGDADFFLVARTDARATSAKTGLSEAIARANLYIIPSEDAPSITHRLSASSASKFRFSFASVCAQAGADACFVEAPRSDDELKEIGRRTNGLRVCNMIEWGITPLHTPQELKVLYAAARAITDVLKTLKEEGTTKGEFHKLATFEEFNKLVDLDYWFQLEARFAPLKDNSDVRV
ncbi:unnamed protein product [Spirodela intermedia]|uniref:Uncharacterized protein n=1 Tax=Spirodela intermedia TaxID=51605 RepID=A0A7I8ITA5_SPIIN|nr:unnamed protein product [Spirodela intermedia]CAA6660375.1 unnamed protein product [Spirodela intermedia]